MVGEDLDPRFCCEVLFMTPANLYTEKDNLWREYLNPLRWLSMEKIVQLIEQGERGAFADLQWFYQAMERSDAIIATVIQRRRAALLACSWDCVPEDKPTDSVLADEQASFLRGAYDKIENLRESVAFLATAMFRGFAHAEKHFNEAGELTRLEPVEQWFWVREGMFGEWRYNKDTRSGVTDGEPIQRDNFVIVENSIALDRILSVQYFRRNLAQLDWTAYLNVYGIPSVFFTAPQGADSDKMNEFLVIAQALVKDGRGVLPYGTDVKFVTGGGSGKPPFLDHLAYIDKQIVLVGTGGLLTMLTESGSGTLAGGAHSDAFKQVANADAVLVSEALRRDFDKPSLEQAFPGWPVEAGFKLIMEEPPPNPYEALMPKPPGKPSAYAEANGLPQPGASGGPGAAVPRDPVPGAPVPGSDVVSTVPGGLGT
jgi:phage gp29-like protein